MRMATLRAGRAQSRAEPREEQKNRHGALIKPHLQFPCLSGPPRMKYLFLLLKPVWDILLLLAAQRILTVRPTFPALSGNTEQLARSELFAHLGAFIRSCLHLECSSRTLLVKAPCTLQSSISNTPTHLLLQKDSFSFWNPKILCTCLRALEHSALLCSFTSFAGMHITSSCFLCIIFESLGLEPVVFSRYLLHKDVDFSANDNQISNDGNKNNHRFVRQKGARSVWAE